MDGPEAGGGTDALLRDVEALLTDADLVDGRGRVAVEPETLRRLADALPGHVVRDDPEAEAWRRRYHEMADAAGALKAAVRPQLDAMPHADLPEVRRAFNAIATVAGRALDALRSGLRPPSPATSISPAEERRARDALVRLVCAEGPSLRPDGVRDAVERDLAAVSSRPSRVVRAMVAYAREEALRALPQPETSPAEALTPERYVAAFVAHGERSPVPVAPWERAFQDAGAIEAAERAGYVWIGRDIACTITLTGPGRKVAELQAALDAAEIRAASSRAAEAGEARASLVRRDYRAPDSDAATYAAVLHTREDGLQDVGDLLGNRFRHGVRVSGLLSAAGIEDGDAFEIAVRRTGERPFGDRRYLLVADGTYRPETDGQMAFRQENGRHWNYRTDAVPDESGHGSREDAAEGGR